MGLPIEYLFLVKKKEQKLYLFETTSEKD